MENIVKETFDRLMEGYGMGHPDKFKYERLIYNQARLDVVTALTVAKRGRVYVSDEVIDIVLGIPQEENPENEPVHMEEE